MHYNLQDVKIRILNFVRTNKGFGPDIVSRSIGVPLNLVLQAVAELKSEGLLVPNSPTLKLGRRQG